jgi:hypothetical protein
MSTRAPRAWETHARRRSAPVEPETVDPDIAEALRDVPTEQLVAFLKQRDLVESAITRRALRLPERSPDGAATLEEAQAYTAALAAANDLLEAVRTAPDVPDPKKVIEAAAEQLIKRTERRVRAEREQKTADLDGMVKVGGPTQKTVIRDQRGHLAQIIEKTPGGVIVKEIKRDGAGKIEGVVEQRFTSVAVARAAGRR